MIELLIAMKKLPLIGDADPGHTRAIFNHCIHVNFVTGKQRL